MKKVYLRGCFDGIHGYGAHIRSHLRLLDKNGIKYELLYVPLDPNVLETDEIKAWRKKIVLAPEQGGVVINFLEASYYKFFSGCRHIGSTQWEVESIPNFSEEINADLAWVERMNRCDEIWTGSKFARATFIRSGVRRPIKVIPWCIDAEFPRRIVNASRTFRFVRLPVWKPKANLHLKLRPVFNFLNRFPRSIRPLIISFAYRCFQLLRSIEREVKSYSFPKETFLITQDSSYFTIVCSNTFNERKNLKDTLASVLSSFKKGDRVRLLMRTHHAVGTAWMFRSILKEMNDWVQSLKIIHAPEVFVFSGSMKDDEYLEFLSFGDVFINTSKGEGVGGGILQAMAMGIPAITHLFSSPEDFCNSENSFVYDYSLEPVAWDFNFYGMGQKWSRPNMESLSKALLMAFELWSKESDDLQKMGERARASAVNYGQSEKVLKAYQEVITG